MILLGRTKDRGAMEKSFSAMDCNDYLASRNFSPLHKSILGLNNTSADQLPSILQFCENLDVNIQDAKGMTSIAWAAMMNDAKAIEVLLDLGADPDIPDVRGTTPLMLTKDPKCMKMLLNAGADVDLPDFTHQPALLFSMANTECLRLLLDHGADTTIVEGSGFIPLHWAVFIGHSKAVEVLLDKGGDYLIPSGDGSSIIHTAMKHGNERTLELLAGANLTGLDIEQVNSGSESVAYLAEIRREKTTHMSFTIDQLLLSLSIPTRNSDTESMTSQRGSLHSGCRPPREPLLNFYFKLLHGTSIHFVPLHPAQRALLWLICTICFIILLFLFYFLNFL